MSDASYSFTYDRPSAAAQFHGIDDRRLLLSLLAGIAVAPAWDGCSVLLGDGPGEPDTTCVVTSGPGADEVQLRLIDAFERQRVRVVAVYEGGPADGAPVAVARGGGWAAP